MKKKQLAKLKKQFRPSFQDARNQLFETMTKKAAELYALPIRVYLNAANSNEMMIELLDTTSRDQQIKVPLDDNFTTVVKRIQNSERGLLDRFSSNLVEEVASYWIPEQTRLTNSTPVETTPVESVATTEEHSAVTDLSTSTKTAEFIAKMNEFPKFFVNETADALTIFEKTAKEDRLLATVSKVTPNEFTLESALERKYKLKLEVIPVIEAYAALALTER